MIFMNPEGRYDMAVIERIYLNADGGRWIKGSRKTLTIREHLMIS